MNRIVTTLAIVFTLFQTSNTFAQKKYQGLLWEITGNGLEKPSYLYGTMHVSKKVAFHLSDAFFEGIKNADVIALEMNPDTWMDDLIDGPLFEGIADMMKLMQRSNFYYDAFTVSTPTNLEVAKALRLENKFTNGFLYRYTGGNGDHEENTYLDLFIFQAGKRQHKSIVSLENFNTVMEMMVKATMPDPNAKKTAPKKRPTNDFMGIKRIEDAYRNGDLDLLDSLQKEQNPTPNFHKYMIIERNKIMADGMDSIMKKSTLFTGVGAAHLPGDEGVINLLREKGYTVKAVPKVISSKSRKMKQQIEKKRLPLVLKQRSTSDSAFVIDLPGKLYEIPFQEGNKQYFYPDMANGSYFQVVRINTFASLYAKTPYDFYKKVDSLLFENIPGQIIKQKKISNNGNPGIDIVNKTRKGDYQRHQIFITPQEIIVFKYSGTKDHALSKEIKTIFESLNIRTPINKTWKEFTPKNNAFTVALPAYNIQHIDNGTSNILVQATHTGKDFFMFKSYTHHDNSYIEQDTFELNVLSEFFLEDIGYEIKTRRYNTTMGYPSITVNAIKDDVVDAQLKVVIKGPEYYLLFAQSDNQKNISKFFDSFQINEYQYKKEFKTFTDSTVLFTVNTYPQLSEDNFFSSLMKVYRGAFKSKSTYEKSTHLYNSENTKILCNETGESINVTFEKYHDYYETDSLESFLDYTIEDATYDSTYKVKDFKTQKSDDISTFDFTVYDTASVRCIKYRIIYQEGKIYTLTYDTDTLSSPSKFQQEFFESFQPLDSAIGVSILEDKKARLFKNLLSEDSTTRVQAQASINYFSYENEDYPKLKELLLNFNFEEESDKEKEDLIRAIRYLDHPDIPALMKQLYQQAGDTSSLQLAILDVLFRQNKLRTHQLGIKLMTDETPITSNSYKISRLLSTMEDSLELTKKILPSIMKLNSYEDYKEGTYDMLGTLLDSNLISKAELGLYKKQILRDAKLAHKKYISASESSDTRSSEYSLDDFDFSGLDIPESQSDFLNNFIKSESTTVSYNNNYVSSYDLINYAQLLIPFRNEPSTSAFLEKLRNTAKDDFKLSLNLLFLENDIPVDDSVWTNLQKDNELMIQLYNRLDAMERLDLLNDSLLNFKHFAEVRIMSRFDLEDDDSLVFIGSAPATLLDDSTEIYYYKYYQESNSEYSESNWELIAIETTPEHKKDLGWWVYPFSVSTIYDNDDVEELIEDHLNEYRFTGRERYQSPNKSNYSSSMFGY